VGPRSVATRAGGVAGCFLTSRWSGPLARIYPPRSVSAGVKHAMFDRELTQLISIAKHYLDAADSLSVLNEELASTVSANSASWSKDRRPRPLSPLDAYSAHLASCATRLATIHEILVGDTEKAWAVAYPNDATITDNNLGSATTQGLEILLRDNVAHAEDPKTRGVQRSRFRKAALARLTFRDIHEQLRIRYQKLADEMLREPIDRG